MLKLLSARRIDIMNYKNAFKCYKCPQSNDEKGCPMWWEITETRGEEVKITKACGYTLMPMFLLEVVKASGQSTAASNQSRNMLLNALTGKKPEYLDGPTV